MANEEQLKLLRQGVEGWNAWGEQNKSEIVDLREANLHEANLRGANLSKANLSEANLSEADLSEADLSGADLRFGELRETDFHNASLSVANLSGANLSGANLSGANLIMADLSNGAYLVRANLSGADCHNANFNGAIIGYTDFTKMICAETVFADCDLSTVKGLETVIHKGPSTIGFDSLFRVEKRLPDVFLRGCGAPEIFLTYYSSMRETAIEFYSCFISYSHANKDFAQQLYDKLQGQGIRCWLDEHELNPGDPMHSTIYEAIRTYDKVLLCCSQQSLTSWWVEKEFNRAIRKEEDYREQVLVPLNVDGYLFTPDCVGWIADEIKQRFVADFTDWKDFDQFEQTLKKVIKALRTDGGKEIPPTPKLGKH